MYRKIEELNKFVKELKARGGHVLDTITNYRGYPMLYYREPDAFQTDTKTKVFN